MDGSRTGVSGEGAVHDRIAAGLLRAERALGRIETLATRHEALRREVEAALADLDRVIAQATADG